MIKSNLVGIASGVVLGLVNLLLGAHWTGILFLAALGFLISFVAAKKAGTAIWIVGPLVGAGVGAVMSLLGGGFSLQSVIQGAISGLIISALMKFVTPMLLDKLDDALDGNEKLKDIIKKD